MTWVLTSTGTSFVFNVDNPELINPWDINIKDIAHALSRICRYNGHTKHHYSVAEHSVRVCSILTDRHLEPMVVRAGLMHDATEAYIGDMPGPLKDTSVGDAFRAYEEALWLKVAKRFRLPKVLPEKVREVDKEIQSWEIESYLKGNKVGWSAAYAEQMFLDMTERLEIA